MAYAVKQRNALNQLAPVFMTVERHAGSRSYRDVLLHWYMTHPAHYLHLMCPVSPKRHYNQPNTMKTKYR